MTTLCTPSPGQPASKHKEKGKLMGLPMSRLNGDAMKPLGAPSLTIGMWASANLTHPHSLSKSNPQANLPSPSHPSRIHPPSPSAHSPTPTYLSITLHLTRTFCQVAIPATPSCLCPPSSLAPHPRCHIIS
ncbi:unnamed protein product [Cyclocybe aegerita]|uniref:Uncharacterized protein n=1 Tax=Cyclocybe aegerita TaxID=1973307 RepID=A0A8S0WQC6_CYCAE|nr:unnamed protein product [Cyclocybe aegerita]